MSSTFVADTTDDCKTDNTLIIIVNNDGTISVDQETLQNLLANQQNAPVSVVRVGAASQGDDNSQDSNGTCDSQNDGNPHVNLTVEGFYPQVAQTAGTDGALPSVGETPLDPFLEMDPEQLERLETALQSEQAKQILGENVTAMLDMLSVEEEASKLKDTIRMDHCYTNLSPSSAPVLPSSNTVSSNQNDGDTASSNDEDQVKVTSSSGRGSVRGTRGRGRGPGRPRKDGSVSRPTASYRGAGRGGVRGQSARGGTANHVLMQQMQHITPPPNAPSATLVPLIKPLVLPSNASTTVTLSPGQAFAQKQILPVQSGGGARFVTLAAKPSGQNVSAGQQRILVTNNSTVQLQSLKIPISQSAGQVVTASSVASANSGSQSSQVTSSTLTPGAGQAKVLVAKMPSIPPQLLGAQPTTASVDSSKIISKNNLSEDDTEFSKFSQDEESEETEEADTDDEDFMIMANKRSPVRGGRPGRGRRIRLRGQGRGWDRGRMVRGMLKRRGLGRGGRGSGRSEDLSQVHKLDSEMASALIAMSRSPEPEEPARESPEKGSPSKLGEADKDREDLNASFSPDAGKKRLKIAAKVGAKRKSGPGGVEAPSQELAAEKKEESAAISKDEKVNAAKVGTAKHAEEAQAKQPAATEQKPDSRKNYPKRENRKPPAHLAEALGPALFSTPDIIRRVSTGSENKSVLHSPVETKEEPGAVKPEPLSQDVTLSNTSDKVHEANELRSPEPKKKVEVTPDKDEVPQEKTEKVDGKANLNASQPDDVKVEVKMERPLAESTPVNSHRTESGGAARPNRKRNIQLHLDGLLKKDPSLKHQGQGKDKKSRNVQTKGRGRRRSEDVKVEESDEDDDDQSSDDESWNSEDDPDRLWCICKKPHNNRFMICCDSCEDWFHGKCVGITKAMGKQMENKGLEWRCPNCTEKKQPAEEKVKDMKRKVVKEKEVKKHVREAEVPDSHSRGGSSDNKKDVIEEQTIQPSRSSLNEAGMFCIVCKKAARSSSIYCSDECILKHAKESLSEKGVQSANRLNQTVAIKTAEPNSTQLPKARLDARVMVFERKTGKLLSGANAPTVANLKSWLKDNPTFEVVRPGDSNTNKILTKQSVISKYMEPKEDRSAAGEQGQAKLGPSQQAKKSILVQQKISQLLPKPTQAKSAANAQLQTSETSNSQPKASTPSKTLASPHKGGPSQKGVIVLGKLAQPAAASPKSVPAKGMKQTILIPTESVHKMGPKAATKSPGVNSSKAPPKSPVPSSPTKSQHATPKAAPPPVVSKVPATSTVKDPEKVVVRKIELKRTSVEPGKKEKDKEEEKEKEKPAGPEPIRLNVRKTLQELLQMRIQECDDLTVAEGDIQSIALHIEEEMHSYFRDTGIKYKSKYRSLVFNIKDPKNLTLFRKIADKSVTPYQLVRLSPEELASQELAQWRERETKHQIEWIKKNELDMLSLSKTYVMKTHKGEQVIEADDSLKAEVPDLVDPAAAEAEVKNLSNNSVTSTVEDGKLSSKKDKGKGKEKGKESKGKSKKDEREKSHEKDKSKSGDRKSKEKSEKGRKDDEEPSKREHRHHRSESEHERHRSSRRERHSSESKSHDHEKRKDKPESSHREKRDDEEKPRDSVDSAVEEPDEAKGEAQSTTDIKEPAKDEGDTDPSDREPTSTVSIKTPDINVEETDASVWKGFVNMPDVAKFLTSVQVVSGDPQNLGKDLPESVDIVGRIVPHTVWDYISKMKKTGTKEILVIRLTATNDEEKIPYITLYTYLNTRNRLGVVGNCSKMIKDFYIMPLPSYEQVPQVLLPLRGPGFEDYRPHLLLGIIVRSKRKRLAPENEYVAKVPKRTASDDAAVTNAVAERSYTPPLPSGGSLTPPRASDSYTPPLSPTQSFYSVSQHHRRDRRKKAEERQDKHKASAFSDDEDADAPYSPGGSDDDVGDSSEDNLLSTPKNPSELERKMEELNRKIEEQKQQIQCISSAIVGSDATVTSGSIQMKSVMQSYVLGSGRKSEDPDESEAYSPSRSFTPPPSTPSVLTSITSNISIPSNLQEILASIKKQETASGSKGINLKTDPIVQNYGSAQPEAESVSVGEAHYSSNSSTSTTTYTLRKSEATLSQTQLQSASSALLSLSTPVIHTLHPAAVDSKTSRDPRQRGSSTPETAGKVAGSTLSTLSDDDLIKKAAEMMEMEKMDASDKAAAVSSASGKLYHSTSVVDVHPSLQPLPPGVEDDYSSYASQYVPAHEPPSPSKLGVTVLPSGAIKYPTPHGAVVSYPVAHHYKPPPPPPPATPPPPPPPPPPPSAYNMSHGSSKDLGYGSSYQSQGGYPDGRKMLPRKKRKYDDGPGGGNPKRDGGRGKSPPPPGRDAWDPKVPPHMRGRYGGGMRGRGGYARGGRGGYARQRGGRGSSDHEQMRWEGQPPDKHFNRRKSPRYDAGIRSEWDMHIKDFEEKHRERSRQLRHGRDRRDRSSGGQRSSRSGSRRNRDSSSP